MTKKKSDQQPKAAASAKSTNQQAAQADSGSQERSLKDEIEDEMKADLTEELDDESVDVVKLQKERDEFEDNYLRAAAEIKNMNNRFHKERADLLKYDGQKLATAVLPVLDNLERALATEVTDDAAKSLKQGVQMVYDHLATALKENAVEEIASTDDKFDPSIHQAVQTVPADKDHPKDTVVQVLQKGYRMKDRILRPAMVVVAN